MLSSRFALGMRFLTHWLNAVDEHSLQAPFIYDFYTRVVKGRSSNQAFQEVQRLKEALEKDQTLIDVSDFGTGSQKPGKRAISYLTKTSHQPKVSRVLFNIVSHYQPMTIVELGTSLGLSALQMAAAAPQADIFTLEGCDEISKVALLNFKQNSSEGIQLITGNIDHTLNQVLSRIDKIDLLFMDANHQLDPTLNYFDKCLTHFHESSVVVIDDIHWSQPMQMAWEQIKSFDRVTVTIDLFYAGVVLFNGNLHKSHYVLSL